MPGSSFSSHRECRRRADNASPARCCAPPLDHAATEGRVGGCGGGQCLCCVPAWPGVTRCGRRRGCCGLRRAWRVSLGTATWTPAPQTTVAPLPELSSLLFCDYHPSRVARWRQNAAATATLPVLSCGREHSGVTLLLTPPPGTYYRLARGSRCRQHRVTAATRQAVVTAAGNRTGPWGKGGPVATSAEARPPLLGAWP